MKIQGSMMNLAASYSHTRVEVTRETLTAGWMGRPEAAAEPGAQAARDTPRPAEAAAPPVPADKTGKAAGGEASGKAEGTGPRLDGKDMLRFSILSAFVEALTGRKLELETLVLDEPSDETAVPEGKPSPAGSGREAASPESGFGVHYRREEWRAESERFDFQAQSRVRTADGREIELDLSLSMSREVVEYSEVDIRAGAARLKDPLVINFDGGSAELESRRMHFDIDADGEQDRVARLAAGSGFLALDRDGNGRVTDGSELFGAMTGDGFGELARFDADGNGWIDEADPIWDRLQVWLHEGDDEQGRLIGLGQSGVGAIFLGRVATPFAVHDGNGEMAGQLRESGLYLREDGGAGTVQKLDLVV